MFRRIAMCWVLIFVSHSKTQLIVFLSIQILSLGYSCVIRSMDTVVDNINTIISDITMTVVTAGVFMYPVIDDTDFDEDSNEDKGFIF